MPRLKIDLTVNMLEDYDGVVDHVKQVCGSIDGNPIAPCLIEDALVTDDQCKSNFKVYIASLGYKWSEEV